MVAERSVISQNAETWLSPATVRLRTLSPHEAQVEDPRVKNKVAFEMSHRYHVDGEVLAWLGVLEHPSLDLSMHIHVINEVEVEQLTVRRHYVLAQGVAETDDWLQAAYLDRLSLASQAKREYLETSKRIPDGNGFFGVDQKIGIKSVVEQSFNLIFLKGTVWLSFLSTKSYTFAFDDLSELECYWLRFDVPTEN